MRRTLLAAAVLLGAAPSTASAASPEALARTLHSELNNVVGAANHGHYLSATAYARLGWNANRLDAVSNGSGCAYALKHARKVAADGQAHRGLAALGRTARHARSHVFLCVPPVVGPGEPGVPPAVIAGINL